MHTMTHREAPEAIAMCVLMYGEHSLGTFASVVLWYCGIFCGVKIGKNARFPTTANFVTRRHDRWSIVAIGKQKRFLSPLLITYCAGCGTFCVFIRGKVCAALL